MSKGTVLKLKKISVILYSSWAKIQPLFGEQRHKHTHISSGYSLSGGQSIWHSLSFNQLVRMLQRHYMNVPQRACVCVCWGTQCLSGHSAPQAMVCVWKGMDPPQGVQGGDVCECPYSTFAAVCLLTQQSGIHVCSYTDTVSKFKKKGKDVYRQFWIVSKDHHHQSDCMRV